MKARRSLFLLTLFTLIFSKALAQYYDSGQDPSSIKWNQIKTDNFQIIFPAGFEKESMRLANSLEKVYNYATYTLKANPKRISIILHNYSSIGNAFVAWAPKRAEFYTIPPQDLYPQDWLDQLAIHEYRHVIQISKLNQGFTKALSIILGEQGTAAILGLFVPLWFLEGDAVTTETTLSTTGRGRLPEFEMLLRTQVIGQKIFSYEKEYFGSYKDFVPDYYKMGYYLVAYGRKKYGYELWDNTLNNVARKPISFTPFSKGIKRTTHQSKWKFYKHAFSELDSLWKEERDKITYNEFQKLNNDKKHVYTNYRFPQYLNDSTIIALKSGLGDIYEFVKINKKQSSTSVFIPGFMNSVRISASNDRIIWTEYGFDKRWENRIYSDIIIYDTKKKDVKRLSQKKYLFAPCLSPDASQVVAVNVDQGNIYSLVFIEVNSGRELKRINSPDNNLIFTPIWSADGNYIAYSYLTEQGKSFAILNVANDSIETVLPFSYNDITQPVMRGNIIYYHGTKSGIDNIYALNIPTRKVYQITSAMYGAFDPCISPDGKKLIYANYSPKGYDIVETELDSLKWISLDSVSDRSIKLYQTASEQEKGIIHFDSVASEYEIKRYRKFTHLLNIHSWAPAYIDVNNYNLNPGVSILSQNKLSTFSAVVGYQYNYNEGTGRFSASINFKAWYPLISFLATDENRKSYLVDSNGKYNSNWRESNISLVVSQPLNFTKGRYQRSLIPSASLGLKNIYRANNVPENFHTGYLSFMRYSLKANRTRKVSKRDIRPRWGQKLEVQYSDGLNSDIKLRSLFASELELYFPGIVKHHSLKLTLSYQNQGKGVINFSSPITPVRGYYRILNTNHFNKFSFDYALPLIYPDLRLGAFVYLQRVKANLFFDYAQSDYIDNTLNYKSVGVEFTNDMNLVNFIFPVDVGFRIYYLPDQSATGVQIVFGTTL